MQVSGKLITIGIFGVGLVAAVAAFFVQYNSRRQVREFWGPETAVLINRAPKVELLRLKSGLEDLEDGELLTIDGVAYQITERKDISKARGFVHVRDALIRDTGFEWDKDRGDCQADWQFAFQFNQDDDVEVLVFDFNCQRVRLMSGGQEACISPIFEGIQESILREMPKEEDDKSVRMPPEVD
jgi:hypothetical protein